MLGGLLTLSNPFSSNQWDGDLGLIIRIHLILPMLLLAPYQKPVAAADAFTRISSVGVEQLGASLKASENIAFPYTVCHRSTHVSESFLTAWQITFPSFIVFIWSRLGGWCGKPKVGSSLLLLHFLIFVWRKVSCCVCCSEIAPAPHHSLNGSVPWTSAKPVWPGKTMGME